MNSIIKQIVLVTAIFCLTSVSFAASEKEKECENISKISEAMMMSRQNGKSIVAMYKTAEKYPYIEQITKAIIDVAYEKPMWNTEENKAKAIVEFSNEMFMLCMKHKK